MKKILILASLFLVLSFSCTNKVNTNNTGIKSNDSTILDSLVVDTVHYVCPKDSIK